MIEQAAKDIGAIVAQIDANLTQVRGLISKAEGHGVRVPLSVLSGHMTATDWWKAKSELFFQKLTKRQAREAVLAKLTEDERNILGL
jgi:hypothetical protein